MSADSKAHGFLLRDGEFAAIDFPGATSTPATTGINGRGDVSGIFSDSSGKLHGFLLSGGADCRLDPPPSDCFTQIDFPGASDTRARKMNPQGDLVGEYCDSSTTPRCNFIPTLKGNMHGFVLSGGSFTSIDVPGAILTQAWGINAEGQIVGRYYSSDGKHHIFLLSEGRFTSIDFPGAVETAVGRFTDNGGINAHGVIVGDYCDAEPCPSNPPFKTNNVHAFLLRTEERDDDGEGGEFVSFDFPGALGSVAFGVNVHGDVVGGYADTSNNIHGFLRSSGDAPVPVTGTFSLTFEPVSVRQADGDTVTDFTFHEQISGSIAGTRVGTGTLVVHPDGTLTAEDTGPFTGTVAGVPGSVIAEVRGKGTFASITATAMFDSSSGTGGLRGLRGRVRIRGAATGPTTIAGSYDGQVRFQADDDD